MQAAVPAVLEPTYTDLPANGEPAGPDAALNFDLEIPDMSKACPRNVYTLEPCISAYVILENSRHIHNVCASLYYILIL